MRTLVQKCNKLVPFGLRLIIFTTSIILLILSLIAMLWGGLGALTVNTPPFDENSYVDHTRAPFRFKTLMHLNPFTLLLYNGFVVTLGSIAGVVQYSCPSIFALITHLAITVTALALDYLLEFSIYWDPDVMKQLFTTMETFMKSYGNGVNEKSVLFMNSTEYWDLMQMSRDCCGLTGFHDWIETSYHSNSNLSFPDSCCRDVKPNCGIAIFGSSQYDITYGPMRTRGCLSTFPESLTTDFHKYSGIVRIIGTALICNVTISMFLILLTLCKCYINFKTKKKGKVSALNLQAKQAEDPNSAEPNIGEREGAIPEVGTGDFTMLPGNESRGSIVKSLITFRQSSTSIIQAISHQVQSKRNLVRETVSNFLFPTTSSTRSYVQGIFSRRETKDQGTNPSNNPISTTPIKKRSIQIGVSSHTLKDGGEEPLQKDLVHLKPREDLGKGEMMVIPTLLTVPTIQSQTLIIQNEVVDPKTSWISKGSLLSKIGLGDRKSESGESLSRSKMHLRIGSPSRVHPMPISDSGTTGSLATLYRYHDTIVPFQELYDEGGRISRMNSLEGLRISPSEESVRVILNPMFGDISSDSPDEI